MLHICHCTDHVTFLHYYRCIEWDLSKVPGKKDHTCIMLIKRVFSFLNDIHILGNRKNPCIYDKTGSRIKLEHQQGFTVI